MNHKEQPAVIETETIETVTNKEAQMNISQYIEHLRATRVHETARWWIGLYLAIEPIIQTPEAAKPAVSTARRWYEDGYVDSAAARAAARDARDAARAASFSDDADDAADAAAAYAADAADRAARAVAVADAAADAAADVAVRAVYAADAAADDAADEVCKVIREYVAADWDMGL